jgi:hypothetical protein
MSLDERDGLEKPPDKGFYKNINVKRWSNNMEREEMQHENSSNKRPTIKERAERFYSTGETSTMSEAILKARIEVLKEKKKNLESQHKATMAGLQKVELSKKHREDTKRKIMIGGWVIAAASNSPLLRSIIERDAIPYLASLEPDLFSRFELQSVGTEDMKS